MQLRVALAQTCPISASIPATRSASEVDSFMPFAELKANLADAKQWVEKAALDKADVVVFPEYFLQGIVDSGRQYLAYPANYLLEELQQYAIELNICIVGTIVFPVFTKDHGSLPTSSPFSATITQTARAEWSSYIAKFPGVNHDPYLRNTAIFIEGGTGKVIGEYSKRNLWHPERTYLSPGQVEHRVFETKWGKCGFLICWDVSHPNSGQALANQGVDIVFAPTYWIGAITPHNAHPPSYESELLSSLSCARSFETETVWILCNAGGPPGEGYIGCSSVYMPFKGKLGGVQGVEAGYQVVDIDLNVLKDARKLYKIRTENNR